MREILIEYLKGKASALKRKVNVGLIGYGSTNRAFLDFILPLDFVNLSVRHKGLSRSELPKSVTVYGGESEPEIYEDILIPSPSVRREKIAAPVGAEFITDYDLLFRTREKQLFCVSGSDGKSTVTTLSSLMLSETMPDLFTGGNLGTPLICADSGCEAFLLELSSFTLHYSVPRSKRALLTNITPNHLDWHKDLLEYTESKLRLIKSAYEPVINLSDGVSQRVADETNAFCLVSDKLTRGEINAAYSTEHTVTIDEDAISLDGETVVRVESVKRRERHNITNLALATALSIGYASPERIREVAKSFTGLSERCEIFTYKGIEYISSSIDTTPERTRTTLLGLSRPVSIILGGRTKNLPLDPIREPLHAFAKRIAIYGEAAKELDGYISSCPELCDIPREVFPTLDGAIDYAIATATPEISVLLSPAATSYGEFDNYIERGRFFKAHVLNNRPKI